MTDWIEGPAPAPDEQTHNPKAQAAVVTITSPVSAEEWTVMFVREDGGPEIVIANRKWPASDGDAQVRGGPEGPPQGSQVAPKGEVPKDDHMTLPDATLPASGACNRDRRRKLGHLLEEPEAITGTYGDATTLHFLAAAKLGGRLFGRAHAEVRRLRAERDDLAAFRAEVIDALEGRPVPDQGIAQEIAALRRGRDSVQDPSADRAVECARRALNETPAHVFARASEGQPDAEEEIVRVVVAGLKGDVPTKDLRGQRHRAVGRDDAVLITGAEYLRKSRAEKDRDALREELDSLSQIYTALKDDYERLRAERDALRGVGLPYVNEDDYAALHSDFQKLGNAFVTLYLQGLNGVVCDPEAEPGRHGCSSCLGAWKQGLAVVKKHDPKAGNMFRSGESFQPGTATDDPMVGHGS